MNICKRFLALLLAVILVAGLVPAVYAEGNEPVTDGTEESTPQETPTEADPESPDDGEDEGSTYIDTYSSSVVGIEEPGADTPALYADTTGFLWNYDSLVFGLKTNVSASYTDAQGVAKQFVCSHLQWHYVDEPQNLVYCLEPNKPFGYGDDKPGDNVTTGGSNAGTNGQNAWYLGLTANQRRAIALVLLYGCPNGLWDAEAGVSKDYRNPNRGYRAATQAILWEIVTGMRSPVWPYAATNSAFREAGTGVCVGKDGTDYFLYAYDYISTAMSIHETIPSFTNRTPSLAPTIDLTGTTTTVTDTNKVLYRFNFHGSGDVSFTQSGNDLIITTTGNNIPTTPFSAQCTMPSEDEATYQLFYSSTNSASQTVIRVFTPAYDPVPAYFKLRGATGSISGTKTTDTGTDLAGWEMKLMKDGEVIATTTTDENGSFSFTDIPEGTYTLVETVPDDSDYVCTNNNQTVTVATNEDTPVTVHNKQKLGSISIIKNTNTGADLGGWIVELTDAAGAAVGTYTIPDSGSLTIPDLIPGTYTVTEQSNGDAYWICDTEAKTVTVNPGQDSFISLTNTHRGKAVIRKETNTGENRAGWQVGIYSDADCTDKVLTLTTDEQGDAWAYLEPGTYYAREDGHVDGFQNDEYWVTDNAIKVYTVEAGKDVTLTFSNTHKGKNIIKKVTNTGEDLAGWQVDIYSDADCTDKVLTLTTDENGEAWAYMEPGTYYAKEEGNNSPDFDADRWISDNTVKQYVVEAGKDVTVTFSNTLQGKAIINKVTNTGEDLAGWQVGIYSDADCTDKVLTLTTDENGEAWSYMEPGTYYAKEEGNNSPDFDSGYWICDDVVKVFVVEADGEATVTFSNTQKGKIGLAKTVQADGTLAGWQFKVTDKATGKEIPGSPFTTGEDGTFLTGLLQPGEYIVEELIPEGSLYYCASENPQTVTVNAGETAQVTFENRLRPGKLVIHKVGYLENKLPDAKFMLEWSQDGETWQPVTAAADGEIRVGACGSADLTDGCLVTGEDGTAAFEGLHPGLQYRLTEVEAPAGYLLPSGSAWEGELPVDTLEVSVTVKNDPIPRIPTDSPATGDTQNPGLLIGIAVVSGLAVIGLIVLGILSRKQKGGKYAR